MRKIALKRITVTLCALLAMCGFGEDISFSEKVNLAQDGNAEAQFQLCMCYWEGNGVEANYVEAATWCHAAAEQGHAKAQFMLGVCYVLGTGVDKDNVEAAKWFRKAARQGHVGAEGILSYLHNRAIFIACFMLLCFVFWGPMETLWSKLKSKEKDNARHANGIVKPFVLKLAIGWVNIAWACILLCVVKSFFDVVDVDALGAIMEPIVESQDLRGLKMALEMALCGLLATLMSVWIWIIIWAKSIRTGERKNDDTGCVNNSELGAKAGEKTVRGGRNLIVRIIIGMALVLVFAFVLFVLVTVLYMLFIIGKYLSSAIHAYSGLMMAVGAGLGCLLTILMLLMFVWIKCISIGGRRARISFTIFYPILATIFAYDLSLCTWDVTRFFIVYLVILLLPILLMWAPEANEWFRRINNGC